MPAMLRSTLLLRLALVAVGLLVGLSIVLVVANTQDDPVCQVSFVDAPELAGVPIEQPDLPAEFVAEAKRRWASVGEARRSGSSTIVVYVNGLPITAADIAESRAEIAVGLESMRSTVSRIIPDSQVAPIDDGPPLAPGEVRRTFEPYRPIPESSGIREIYQPRIDLIEQHGIDTVALASAIQERALFTAATDAGHLCDDDDVAPWVAQAKTILAEGSTPELEGYVSAVGEEVYLTELLPRALVQRNTIRSWRLAVYDEVIFPEDPRLKWREAARDTFLGARVTLTNDWDLDATVEDAIAYSEAYWSVIVPPTPTVPTPDWTPAP